MRPGASRPSVKSRLLNVLVALATAFGALFTVSPPTPVQAAPLLGGQLFSSGGAVEVEVLPASAGLTSQLYLLEPEEIFIATNREQGKVVEIGAFESGVELVFGIRVGGNEFRMGPGERNPDGIAHATVDFIEPTVANVGFEDLFGGGDRDYDDNRFQFRGGIAAEPPPPDPDPEPEPQPGTPPVAAAGPDQTVAEGSVVQLDGSGSTDPGGGGLVPSSVAGNLPGGTSLEAALSELTPPAGGEQVLTASAAVGEGTAMANTALVYVFDVSGSTLSGGGCGGDANGDGRSNNRIDCEVAAARALNQQAIASGTVAEVGLIGFASGGVAADLSPEDGVQSMTGPGTDADDSGMPDVEQAMASVFTRSFGGSVGFRLFSQRTTGNTTTNFSAGLTAACNLMAGSAQPNRIVAFLSDGENNAGVHVSTVLPCEPEATFHTFAAGPGVSCASNPSRGGLQAIANLTGGTCTTVNDLAALPDILDDLVGSRLVRVELTIDGGEPLDATASATPLPPLDGPASVEISHALPELGEGVHEVCLTVYGVDAGGEGSVSTCSEVGSGGELTYAWALVESEGPPIILSSATSAQPTFLAIDDASYTFELTVTNGFGLTDTDRVIVGVENVAPELTIASREATARGVTLVNASFTDEGWIDHHTALIDWGDGSEPEPVAISAQGAGWGGFFGSHIYTAAGSYAVTATVTDDDGGSSIAATLELTVAEPVAVWANSQTTKKTFEWTGGGGSITGRVHSNDEVKVAGTEPKTIDGPTEYVTTIAVDGPHAVTPVESTVQPFPITYNLADYAPGGAVAVQVGAAYFDHTADCVSGTWDVGSAVLPPGVHYAPCAVKLNGSSITGRFTLAATGAIELSGSSPAFEPYYDGLLLLSGATGKKAINVSASASKFLGVIFAGSGEVSLSGSDGRFFCGIYGDTVTASGSNLTLRGASCGRPDSTVSEPILVPQLGLTLDGTPTDVLPGATIDYGLTLSNDGALLVIPGLLGLENVDAAAASTMAYRYVLEYFSIADGAWLPLASASGAADGYTPAEPLPTTGGIILSARPNPNPGVSYAAGGDVLLGAEIGPGGFATWGYQALVELTPDQINLLMDASAVGGLRNQIEFELTPAETQVRRLFRFGSDFIADVRALTGDITDVEVTATRPTGDPSFLDAATTPALASLTPGATVEIPDSYEVATIAPRVDGESDAAYLVRLLAADGAELFAAAFARASGGVGLLVAPQVHVGSTQHLPVVEVTKAGPARAIAGATLDYEITLANRGSVDAEAVDLSDRLDDEPLATSAVPTTLVPGQIADATASFELPDDHAGGTITNRAEATWADGAGNTYGPLGADRATVVLTPPDLSARLADSLAIDADSNGVVSPGDTLAYEAVVRNDGDSPLTDVTFDLEIDPKSTLVPGSVSATAGTVTAGNTSGDTAVSIELGALAGHGLASIHLRVVIADPFDFEQTLLSVQGSIESAELDPVLTDDPGVAGPEDPTTTRVVIPAPLLHVTLTDAVSVDRDGDGVASPNDTIRYAAAIENQGSAPATGLSLMLSPDPNSRLVADSVTASDGTITSGQDPADGFVKVLLASLDPLATLTVTFEARVADPFPSGVASLSVQGIVNADEFGDPIITDDPDTAAEADPTVTSLNLAGGPPGSGLPAPTIGEVSPAEGAEITEPTAVSATLIPPDGETVAGWTVSYRLEGDSARTEIASGSGTAVEATLDPTVMPNGAYVVEIEATASGGGVSVAETSVTVEGNLKLGRFQVTYQDLNVPVGGIPIQVLRTYDSFDKSRGDFGVGWTLELANFRVSTNGPLGQGGWTMFGCGGGLIFVPLCFESDRPHYVTVVWPDGRVEKFDLTPAEGSNFLPGVTQARFTARPGTTSKLTAVANSLYWSGDGNLYGGLFGSGGLYDPTRFRLTDRFGTEYLLDADRGLVSATDRNGNTVTVSDNGIVSSLGPSIAFDRDALGRITTVTAPDGAGLTYAYDAAGDLVEVTDANGNTSILSYAAGHYLTGVDGAGAGPFQTLTYEDGRLVSVTDANGNTTRVTTDPDARDEVVTSADGRLTTITTFDGRGNAVGVEEVADGTSRTEMFTYDELDRLVSRTNALGHTISATYDADGNLTSYTLPDPGSASIVLASSHENTTTITYNAVGLPTSVTDANGATTTYMYDAAGNLIRITDPLGHAQEWTYDSAGNPVTKTDQTGAVWTFSLDAAGRVTSRTDPLDRTTTYTYDSAGRLLTATDPAGGTTTYSYDSAGNLVSEADPIGRTDTYSYDERDLLASWTNPAGGVTTYDYDGLDNLTALTNPAGETTTYTYDALNRLLTATDPTDATTTRAYDGFGRLASITDPLDRVTTYEYDPADRHVASTGPNGASTTFDYDALGRQIATTSPDGGTTTSAFDAVGRLLSITDPLDRTSTYEYDPLGRVTTTTDPLGRVTGTDYDPTGRAKAVTDAVGAVTEYAYDDAGQLVAMTDALDRTTSYQYDLAGRLIEITDPLGHSATRSYDLAGQLISQESAAGVVTTYEYDPHGLLTTVTDELGNIIATAYDAAGRRSSLTDPNGHVSTWEYDAAGRQRAIEDALDGRVEFAYDDAGQMISVTDPRGGEVRAYTYDALGNLATSTDPLGRVTTRSYDPSGRPATITDARGITVEHTYDLAGQLTETLTPDGTLSYTYDAAGQRLTATDPTGTTTWSYDAAGRITEVAAPAGTVGYAYDDVGQRTGMTLPAGTIGYGYDAPGRVTSVTDWTGGTTSFEYDPDGRQTLVERPNGVDSEYVYDDTGRLTGIAHLRPDGTPLEDFTYSLDAAGNRTSVTSNAGVEDYTLDELDRLTRVEYANGDVVTYTYDPGGNIASRTLNGATTTYAYDAANQLISATGPDGTVSYAYDDAGNLIEADTDTFAYDWANRMVEAAVDGTGHTYAYDADGVRVDADGAPQLWDRVAALPELVDDGAMAYLHSPDGASVLVQYDGAEPSNLLPDALGSTRFLTDASGTGTGTAAYDAFGAIRSSTGASSPFGFAGELLDPTGLIHLRARHYDPVTARFTAADTIQPNGFGTSGWNVYSYAANNPMTLADPSGQTVAGYSATTTLRKPLIPALGGIGLATKILFGGVGAILLCAVVLCEALPNFDPNEDDELPDNVIQFPKRPPDPRPVPPIDPIPPFDPNPDPPDEDDRDGERITSYRGVDGNPGCASGLGLSPGAFRVDPDGVSTFERPNQGSNKPCLVPFDFSVMERVAGVTAPLAAPAGCTATYTPQFGFGHWSINCAGPTAQLLSEHAKVLRQQGRIEVNELFLGGD